MAQSMKTGDERLGTRVIGWRSAWSLADQMVSSVTNLVLLVLVARAAPLPDIGAFAVAFTIYQFVLALSRPLNTDPLVVRFSAAGADDHRRAAFGAVSGALCLGIALFPFGLAASAVLGGPTGGALLALGGFAPALFVQDAWRFVFIGAGVPRRALTNDVVMLVTLLGAGVFVTLWGQGRAVEFVVAWGIAASAGTVVGLFQTSIRPRMRAGISWWRETGSLGSRMLGENVLAMGAYSLTLLAIALLTGVSELGKLRTAQVAVAVTNPVMLAAGMVVAAEGTRLRSASDPRLRRLVEGAALAVAAVPLVIGLLWWLLPEPLGRALLGGAWEVSRSLVPVAALLAAGIGATTVLSAGLRAVGGAASALRCRALAAPLTVSSGVVAAALAGPGAAVGAMATAELLCTAMMRRTFRLATRGDDE